MGAVRYKKADEKQNGGRLAGGFPGIGRAEKT
jgi:hypothetical protein